MSLNEDKKINVNSILKKTDTELKLLLNPSSLYVKKYVVLDSFYRDKTVNDGKNFSWGISNNKTITQGFTNINGYIKNLIQIKVYDGIIPLPKTEFNKDTRRISMLIKEYSNDSFIFSDEGRYHFLFKPQAEQGLINPQLSYSLGTTGLHDGLYTFKNPITKMEKITINFKDPTELYEFYDDRMKVSITPGATTTLNFSSPHNFANGKQPPIRIIDFSTDDKVSDSQIISIMNQKKGHIPNTITSPTELVINVDTSSISATNGGVYEVFFFNRRIFICAELTFLKN